MMSMLTNEIASFRSPQEIFIQKKLTITQVWDFRKTNVKVIERTIPNAHWYYFFHRTSAHKKLEILNEALKNMLCSFNLNKATYQMTKIKTDEIIFQKRLKWLR